MEKALGESTKIPVAALRTLNINAMQLDRIFWSWKMTKCFEALFMWIGNENCVILWKVIKCSCHREHLLIFYSFKFFSALFIVILYAKS